MKYTTAKLNIIVNGHWNKKIFTPQWIAQKLISKDVFMEGGVEVPIKGMIDVESLELGYDVNGIILSPRANYLQIDFKNDEKKINEATQMLFSILKTLPETPITGLGFNTVYTIEKNDNGDFGKLFETTEFPLKQIPVCMVQFCKQEHSYTLNVTTKKDSNNISVCFNYHHSYQQMKSIVGNPNIFLDYWLESKGLFKND